MNKLILDIMGQFNFICIHNERKKVPVVSSLLSYLLKLTLLLDLNILKNVCSNLLLLDLFCILASLSFYTLFIKFNQNKEN